MAVNNKKVRIGVAGWGGRGGLVTTEAVMATGGLMELVGCFDPIDENYEKGCRRWKITPTRYDSVRQMVDQAKLDGVIIASPNMCHLDNIKELEGLDIPVLMEKPLDSTFEKICEMVRFSRAYKGPVLVGHCMRYAPIVEETKKMLDRGDIGKLCSVRFVQNCHYGNGAFHNWRRTREGGGTQLIEKATHDFDIMMHMVGDLPTSVFAINKLQAFGGDKPNDLRCRDCDERRTCPESIQNIQFRSGNFQVEELKNAKDDLCVYAKEVDIHDNEHVMLDFKGGVFGTYVQWFFSPRSYHHRIYEFHGTLGALELDLGSEFGGKITFCPRFGTLADKQVYNIDYLQRNHYNGDGNMGNHFYEVCTGQAQPRTTVEQAFMVGHAAVQSGDNRKLIDLIDLLPEDLKDIYEKKVY